mmetsp:Transcript_28978/g.86626  ORF Transcript_28978/g.86626 Transcript_28978/m.86626 type:complete len:236 (+) Transcript_28978:352-1059(+)
MVSMTAFTVRSSLGCREAPKPLRVRCFPTLSSTASTCTSGAFGSPPPTKKSSNPSPFGSPTKTGEMALSLPRALSSAASRYSSSTLSQREPGTSASNGAKAVFDRKGTKTSAPISWSAKLSSHGCPSSRHFLSNHTSTPCNLSLSHTFSTRRASALTRYDKKRRPLRRRRSQTTNTANAVVAPIPTEAAPTAAALPHPPPPPSISATAGAGGDGGKGGDGERQTEVLQDPGVVKQ